MAEDTPGTKEDGNTQEKDGYGTMATGYKPTGGTGGNAATGNKRELLIVGFYDFGILGLWDF